MMVRRRKILFILYSQECGHLLYSYSFCHLLFKMSFLMSPVGTVATFFFAHFAFISMFMLMVVFYRAVELSCPVCPICPISFRTNKKFQFTCLGTRAS